MTDIMLNRFIRDCHSDKTEGFADKMVKHVRDNIGHVIFRGKKGYDGAGRAWYFDPKDTDEIKAFVMDQKNILKVTEEVGISKGWGSRKAAISAITAHGLRANTFSNGLIRFGSVVGNITLSMEEAPTVFNELATEVQNLTDKNEALSEENEALKKAIGNVRQLIASKIRGSNVAVFGPKPVTAQSPQVQSIPVPSSGQPIRQKTREDVVRELVEIMVKNPDVLVGNQTKQQAKRKLCKIANEAGLRTVNGLPWSPWNISNYQKDVMELFKKVEKPRVRLTKDGAIVVPYQHQFAIAAE